MKNNIISFDKKWENLSVKEKISLLEENINIGELENEEFKIYNDTKKSYNRQLITKEEYLSILITKVYFTQDIFKKGK